MDMDSTEPTPHNETDADLELTFYRVCRTFEEQWHAGHDPRIEDFLVQIRSTKRSAVLVELIAIEVDLRNAAGQTPAIDEYLDRFPDDHAAVQRSFQSAESAVAVPEVVKPQAADNHLPHRIADFRVTREIGRGGMGVVYEAVQESLGRRVALKTLPGQLDPRGGRLRRFQREARAIARLHHSNIVDVFGSGNDNGTAFIAMRLIEGQGLDRLIESRLSRRESGAGTSADATFAARKAAIDTAHVGRQIAEALQYAHHQGVLHRDVKPSNILIDSDGTAWLTDFGLAKLVHGDDAASLTEKGNLLGTLRYLPPESLRGEADARGDIYSLGLALYESVALGPALEGSSRIEFIEKHREGRIERLERRVPAVPPDLATIIHKAIDHDPAGRYQTAGELAEDLRRFLHNEPIRARRVTALEHLVRWSRRNKGLAAALSSVAALLLVIAVSSLIAVRHFSTLNSALNATVNDLQTKTDELTDARNTAMKNAEENLRLAHEADTARQTAETARQASQATLADMHTERGFLAADSGDSAAAMLWFAHAATQTPHDPLRQQANRLRARNWMERCHLPVALLENSGLRRRLAFHPDGDLLLTVGSGRAYVWDWQAERRLDWSTRLNGVSDACWLPDGRLAVGLAEDELQIRAARSGEMVQRFNARQQIQAVRCSSDGCWLAVAGTTVHVGRRSENDEYVFERQWKHPRPVLEMRFNHTCDRIVTASEDNTARVFDLNGGSAEPAFGPIPHMAFPYATKEPVPPLFTDGGRLLTIHKRAMHCFDLATRAEIPIEPPLTPVFGLEATPDGRQVVARTDQGCVIWSPDERIELKTGHEVLAAEFSPDGLTMMASSLNSTTKLWSVPWNDATSVPIAHTENPRFCAFSRQGFLATGNEGVVRVWKRPTEPQSRIELAGWDVIFTRPRVGPDGRLVTLGRDHDAPYQPVMQQLTVLDATTGRAAGPTISPGDMIDSCLLADGRSLAVLIRAGQAGTLAVFDVATGQESRSPIPLSATPQSIAPRPGSPTVAVLCQDGSLLVVDPQTGQRQLELWHEPWDWQRAARGLPLQVQSTRVLYTPDGATLISVTPAREIIVRDAQSGAMRFPPIRIHASQHCRTVDVSPDSRRLATGMIGSNPSLRVWDLTTGDLCGEPIVHPGGLWSIVNVRFSPDGNRVLTSHVDGRARLWDIATGKLVCPPMRHPNEIRGAAFTSDGRHCVTVCNDGAVRVWELYTGRSVAPAARYATDHRNWSRFVTAVAVHGDLAFVTAPDYPVLDLAAWLRDPEPTTETLERLALLATSRRIVLGEMTLLSPSEWREQWTALGVKPWPPASDTEQLAGQIDETGDADRRWSTQDN